jgi:DNA primase
MDPGEVARLIRAPRTTTAPAPGKPSGEGQTTGAAPDSPANYLVSSLPNDPVTLLERDVLTVLLQLPNEVPSDHAARVLQGHYTHGALQVVRDAMVAAFDAYAGAGWVAQVVDEVPESLRSFVQQLAVSPLPDKLGTQSRYAMGVANSFLGRDLLRQKAELLGTLQRLDAEAEPERFRQIQQALVDIESARRQLRED